MHCIGLIDICGHTPALKSLNEQYNQLSFVTLFTKKKVYKNLVTNLATFVNTLHLSWLSISHRSCWLYKLREQIWSTRHPYAKPH